MLSLFPGIGVGLGVGVRVGIGVDSAGPVASGAMVALATLVPTAEPLRPLPVQAIRSAIAAGSTNQRIWLNASDDRLLTLTHTELAHSHVAGGPAACACTNESV